MQAWERNRASRASFQKNCDLLKVEGVTPAACSHNEGLWNDRSWRKADIQRNEGVS
jgi:hypothetical protein